MRMLRRAVAAALPSVLIAAALTLAGPGRAFASEPSVPLPPTASTPVSQQTMGSRPTDQATASELHGDQPASSGAKDGGGTYKATPLSASASWQVSEQTGDFSWTYPLRTPPSAGGLDPDLSLAYASSGVDGRTSATNNQASWVGDGWDLSVGFIERSYIPCADDVHPVKTGDMCWRSDNAFASYGSGGGELIRDDATGAWHTRDDDGARIEHLAGAANGDDNGEYWRITTVDGTQYLFGDRSEANSTWTLPVFGNDDGEPCHAASFDASHCTQAWRWNLDEVIDRHGNVIRYDYDTETNSYGMDGKDTAVSYVRGGTLKDAEYGLRDGVAGQAGERVAFTVADRCVPGSDCTPSKKDNWPDVPWDSQCTGATCPDNHSPTFWSTKRLAKVTTQVLDGSSYRDVESWSLDQEFPVNGDGEKPALWLKAVTHTGLAGGTPVTLPAVRFEGTKFANRVDTVDGLGPLLRYRVTGVVSEAGGVTTVTYAPPECTAGHEPSDAATNTMRCFPQTWAKKDFSERTDYFNKYVVAQVTQSDMIAANTEQVTGYAYLDGAAWAYDTSEFTKDADRTWNDFRGFGRVRITKGKPDDPAGPRTMTEKRFYRGMDGDRQNTGTRSVTVTDSEGGSHRDDLWLQGFGYETQTHDGTGEDVVAKTITTPAVQGPTATRGTLKAYVVRPGTVTTYTTLGSGGRRVTRTENSYDDLGQITAVDDLGDTSTAADDLCTRTSYVRDTARWLVSLPSQKETVAAACTATPVYPRDAVSGTRYVYDGQHFGDPPTTGDATTTQSLDSRPASGAVYVTASTAGYDALGRVTSAADGLGRTTTTAYTPAAGGPLTQTKVTDPAGHATTTTLDPAYNQPVKVVDANNRVTETAYDALGNRTQVWLPNRPRASNPDGTYVFSYTYHDDAPTTVTTKKIGPNGDYTSTTDLYDGLLRLRQTQAPASGGGRLITDTTYDSQGRRYKVTRPYFNDAAVDDRLWVASDVDVPQQTVTAYDGAGRASAEIVKGGADELWRTTTAYDGDRSTVTPPAGSTAATTVTDARGRVVERDQYHGDVPTGPADVTRYTYTPDGRIASTTDPAGDVWRRGYDLHGNEVEDTDVDKGTTHMTYDAANQLVTSTDARGVTLWHAYDALGRPTQLRSGSATGTLLSAWTYDTVPLGKGLPATSTRYLDGAAYTSSVLGYNALNLATATQLTVPSTEPGISGTYTTYTKYDVDGSRSSATYAAAGDLPAEAVQFSYDDLAEPTTVTGGYGGTTADYVTDTQYTRYGEAARTQLGDTGHRVWLSAFYDDHTRRVNRTVVDTETPAPMQSDTHYTYDPSGNITSIADTPQGGTADTQCFRTDYLQRITQAWTPAGDCTQDPSVAGLAGPAPYWQSFSYDVVGDRLTATDHTAAGDTVATSDLPDTGHELSAVTTAGPSGGSTARYAYDATGNTTTRELPGGTQQLDWDAEGRLARVSSGPAVTSYVYDTDGSQLVRHDPGGSTLYLDGQELRWTKATGALTTTRYYASGGGATVAARTAAGVTWLAGDLQGTTQIAVNSTSLQVSVHRRTPFGGTRGAAVDFPGDRGFVGGAEDPTTGLTQLGARTYDPGLGRFLSVDPQLSLDDPQQMQGYSYADNSPVTKSDPTGQMWGWLKSVGNAVAKAGNAVHDWVNASPSRKLGLTLVLGMAAVALAPLAAAGFAAATVATGAVMVAGAGMAVMDMKDLTDDKRKREAAGQSTGKQDLEFAFDAAGMVVGPVAKGAGNLLERGAEWSRSVPVIMTGNQAAAGARAVEEGADTINLANGVGVSGVYDSCQDPAPNAPIPCGQQAAVPDPSQYQYCKPGTNMCVCIAPPMASVKAPGGSGSGRTAGGGGGSHPSYNLGPDKPGPGSPTWGSAKSKELGIYQTSDGLYHRNDGKGLAFF